MGFRHPLGSTVQVSGAVYRTSLDDDIQFVSSGGTAINAGFFRNVGRTRRQGGELGFEAAVARWTVALRYSYVAATFQSPITLSSPNNSSANAVGDILVAPGDRIPGLPRHAFKVRVHYAFDSRATAGITVAAFSNQRARGDENNLDRNGAVPGYTLVNLDAQFEFARGWQLFASATNVFDRSYGTFGVLGANFFTGAGQSFDAANARPEQFRTPGAPFGVWAGISYRFNEGKKNEPS